ncbi:hypothetical protein ACFXPY_44495 [Streptomyces sp. NPDC059153]|uniref:hypothetical protein n=1 Tax=unclassified Streptomyces TaxID=2593676 RepID=UPI0036B556CB
MQRHLLARIDAYDAVSSRFRPDSLVTRVANTSGGSTFTFPDLAATVFGLYDILDYDAAYTSTPPGAVGLAVAVVERDAVRNPDGGERAGRRTHWETARCRPGSGRTPPGRGQ